MEQRQLEYFQTLYKTRNITQTAQELYLTRQALSLSIRKLEQELGAPLFRRTKSGLVPTEASKVLIRYIEEQQKLWENARQKIRESAVSKVYRLALHVMYLSPEQIRKYVSYEHPELGYRFSIVNITDSGYCQTLLENGVVDIGITHKPPHTARLFWEKIYDSESYLIVPESDALSSREAVDFEKDLTGKTLLFVSRETMQEVEPIIRAQGGFCKFVESDRVLLQQSLMIGRGGIVVPEQAIDDFAQQGLTAKKLIHFPVVSGAYIIFRENTEEIWEVVETLRSFVV